MREEILRRVGSAGQVAGQVAGVRLVTLEDGPGRGTRVLEFRTGSGFCFDVHADRAMDVGRAEHGGRSLAWLSPVGFPPAGAFPAGEWLRGFGGGLLATCGLEHAFAAEEGYPMHGRIGGLPATLRGYGLDGDLLWAEGETVQAGMPGEEMRLRRRIEARVGGDSLTVRDEVENLGAAPVEHRMLYHVNLGYPAVDEGGRLVLPEVPVYERDGGATEGYREIGGPVAGASERVYVHDVRGLSEVRAAVIAPGGGFGGFVRFGAGELPFLVVWRMLGEGTYVVGLEPSTNRPHSRAAARAAGEAVVLAPGEARRYEVEIGALPDAGAVAAFGG